MELVNDPRKAKIAFIVVLVLAIVFFLGAGALGYLYWKKVDSYKSLADEKKKLEDSIENQISSKTEDLQTQIETLEKEKTDLETDKSALQDQIDNYKVGMAKITAYKEFYKYYNQVIETHSGFTGWTDQEYAVGRSKAEATGDQDFVAVVDYAWNETSVDPTTRVIRVNKAIVTGLERGIK